MKNVTSGEFGIAYDLIPLPRRTLKASRGSIVSLEELQIVEIGQKLRTYDLQWVSISYVLERVMQDPECLQ